MTTELGLFVKDEKVMVSSRKVAEVFEKEHKNVLRDIKELGCSEDFRQLNFEPAEYIDAQGKPRLEYLITRDGFTMLAMGFTGAKAMEFKEKYIAAFNKMEEAVKHGVVTDKGIFMPNFSDPVEAAKAWIEKENERRQLAAKIEEDAPKVDFAEAIIQTNTDMSVSKFAKILKQNGAPMGERRLFKWLRENEWIEKRGVTPTQKAMERGLFRIVPVLIKNGKETYYQPMLTVDGQLYFIRLFMAEQSERNQLKAFREQNAKPLTAPDKDSVPKIDFSRKKRKAEWPPTKKHSRRWWI